MHGLEPGIGISGTRNLSEMPDQPGLMGTSTHFGWVSEAIISTGRRWVVGAAPEAGAAGAFRWVCHAHAETSGAARKIAVKTGFRRLEVVLMGERSQIFQNNQVFLIIF
jgi:hypothetical protein